MTTARSLRVIKIVFTPITIVLIISFVVILIFPHDPYFTDQPLTDLIATIFLVSLVLLLPVDIILKLFLSRKLKRLWLVEIAILFCCICFALLIV
jgi:hypothetical protein